MGKVITNISMSLDGFIAGPQDDVQQLFKWYFGGTEAFEVQGGRMTLKVSPESARLLAESIATTGAMVAGRRMFDLAGAWGGNPPFAPCFILTHNAAQEWVKEGSPFTFVTDGIESAVAQAKTAAGDKNVAIATATTTQQCIKAGLLDEIHIDLVPVLLGDGVRLFEHLGSSAIELEQIKVVEAPGVTHLGFRVLK
ncbi:deaminase [Reticulibacter mediterranei]|uniref:Deaminase n=1 Tax=Reticulibacter mediterranei TaxID=2778369 RepID=A0A8J3IZL3_9CHLR|nr:dihydrofolate reductase family protein [Reticulibacter mediterranei]GHO99675.1 deaminase [Reticulibacter mediterranei]